MSESKLNVKSKKVYLRHRSSESQIKDVYPDLTPEDILENYQHITNLAIEGHSNRKHFSGDEGDICISVKAGEALGDISVNIQFEGKIHAYDTCTEQQNAILQSASTWLSDAMGTLFEDKYDVDMVVLPCPNASKPVEIEQAISRIAARQVYIEIGSEVDTPPINSGPTVTN